MYCDVDNYNYIKDLDDNIRKKISDHYPLYIRIKLFEKID